MISATMLTLGFAFTACSGTFANNEDTSGSASAADQEVATDSTSFSCIASLPTEELNDKEKEGILFMREEEKVARDVYTYLFDKTEIRAFGNISKAEQRHMDAVKVLLDRYDLDDPATGKDYGEFSNNELQQLYDQLISDASAGDIAALKVGALIEEKDILDLQKELDNHVDNKDITQVWTNLRKGSEAHLRAFVWNLKVRGVEYSPVLMSRDAFNKIINKE
jgi:hypothetical protein